MRECIVHIGMRKTGSTSIQLSLGNAKSLTGVKYISFGVRVNCSTPLQAAFGYKGSNKKPNDRRAAIMRAQSVTQLEVLRRGFDDRHDRFVLSGERIHRLTPEGLEAFRTELLQHVDRVRIVAYVRDSASLIGSLCQQHIKTGARLDFNNLERVLPNYRETFERFDQVFGPENVEFWRFDPASFVRKDVVHDFCVRIGATMNEDEIQRDNEGLCRDAVALLYTYRHHGLPKRLTAANELQVKAVVKSLGTLKGGKLSLAAEVVQPYLERINDDIAWMERRMGTCLSVIPSNRSDSLTREEDLFTPSVSAIEWMFDQLGRPLPNEGEPLPSPESIGALMNELGEKLAPDAEAEAQASKDRRKARRSQAASRGKLLEAQDSDDGEDTDFEDIEEEPEVVELPRHGKKFGERSTPATANEPQSQKELRKAAKREAASREAAARSMEASQPQKPRLQPAASLASKARPPVAAPTPMPMRERVAPVSLRLLRTDSPPRANRGGDVAASAPKVAGTPTTAMFFGEQQNFPSGKEAFVWLAERLRQHHPALLGSQDKWHARVFSGASRKYFARSVAELFDAGTKPSVMAAQSVVLSGGWHAFVGVNPKQKFDILFGLALVAGLDYPRDWDIHVTGSSKSRSQLDDAVALSARLRRELAKA